MVEKLQNGIRITSSQEYISQFNQIRLKLKEPSLSCQNPDSGRLSNFIPHCWIPQDALFYFPKISLQVHSGQSLFEGKWSESALRLHNHPIMDTTPMIRIPLFCPNLHHEILCLPITCVFIHPSDASNTQNSPPCSFCTFLPKRITLLSSVSFQLFIFFRWFVKDFSSVTFWFTSKKTLQIKQKNSLFFVRIVVFNEIIKIIRNIKT